MALSAARVVEFSGQPRKVQIKLKDSATYYRGAIIVLDGGDGYGHIPSDAAHLEGRGILTGKFEGGITDYAHVVAASSFPYAEAETGEVWLPLGSAAQTDVGDLVFLKDDADTTKTAGSKTIAYRVLDVDTTNAMVLIDLDSPINAALS